jgi:hypothetical protein
MFKCIYHKKCDWCKKRSEEVYTIKDWCKYYNKNICEECYDKKRL